MVPPSIVQCCIIVTFIAIFKPVLPKSVETVINKGTVLTNRRITREDHHDALSFPSDDGSKPPNRDTLLRRGVSSETTPYPCPKGSSYCETADDYPKDFIKSKLKKQPKFLLDQLYVEPVEVDIDKFGPDTGSSLCSSSTTVIYPKKAKSKEGYYEFVVNDDEYKQGVKVETCSSNGGECSIPGSLSLGYTSHCLQKNILRTLVVLNQNSSAVEGFVTKPFEFPSCCSCLISLSPNRFGNVSPNRFRDEPAFNTRNVNDTSSPKPVKGGSRP